MPTVTLSLQSQRSKPVTDTVTWIEARGRLSGLVHPGDIELKPDSAEVVMDIAPDQYRIQVEVPGFEPAAFTIQVGTKPAVAVMTLNNLCTLLPKVSELASDQKRLLQSLDPTKTPGEVWDALTDNKAATFFQVTHALANINLQEGEALSTTVDRVVRLGGSELKAPDISGVMRAVIGWRMHVVFVGGSSIEDLLVGAGFKRDAGNAHQTHSRFGFVRSFREKAGAPRMQIVTNHEGMGADVDVDAGAFHRSSPHDVYKNFAKRFPDAAKIYKVA